ncbi:LURP-one-related/scramblase family protein [Aeoliella mucimassa]|uniref:Scramblase n=1 Tax=Aeoliella mucimassa TaxID=2527972 RepID=A0A518ALE0_9BACT|nr:LURP-one-related family protein [Aeoliella mucimassa]QDU55539.1 hypothetical protein Pan181_17310 [Aeoliella mucimassa]
MIYRIKEAFWSWGDDSAICDQFGQPVYQVDGAAFSWGDDLSFQDMSGRQLARITQTLFSFKPRYQIQIDGTVFAEVIKEWSWFNQKFTLDVPGPNDYSITGSFWEHEFSFTRQGRDVARVSKSYWAWTDSYGVQTVDNEDDLAILCTCIVIDQVLHDGDRNN